MNKINKMPEMSVLKSRFTYLDGLLYRGGKAAGGVTEKGYVKINIDGTVYFSHRLIFYWHHGYCPEEIDHINRDRGDSRIENLRASSRSSNSHNTSPRGKLGIRGVSWCSYNKIYKVIISVNGKSTRLGSSRDFFVSCCLRKRAELNHPDY